MEIEASARPAYLKPEDGVLMTASEAERYVEQLKPFSIEEVGSSAWMRQHDWLEKLNLQAHHNALSHSDEFVMAALVSHDKLSVLVHELLVIEVWKEKVFPSIAHDLLTGSTSINAYLVLYHEVSIVNLLEVALFHAEACEASGDDALLELADYCHRKLLYLNTDAPKDAAYKERTAAELLAVTPVEDMQEKLSSMRFGISLCAVTILRYLTDYLGRLPLCVMARLLTANDSVMALVPLVDSPPWVRRRNLAGARIVEKYEDNKWVEVPPEERQRLTKPDAQVWLALNNLLVDPRCRAKYHMDDFRKAAVLKLKKHMSEVLFDQLPVLKDLQRVAEEISLSAASSSEDSRTARLILEQVPEMREKILNRNDWDKIGQEQLRGAFAESAENKAAMQQRLQDMLAAFDFEELLEAPKCAACGQPAVQRCSKCKSEWYCTRECQVSAWKRHKGLCDTLAKARGK